MALNVTRYVGFAKETTYGTAGTGTYTYVDAESAEVDPSAGNIISYKGCSGLDYLYAAGAYSVGGSFAMPVDDTAIGYLLKWGMGGYNVTGTSSYTHTFNPSTSTLMDSFSMKIGKDTIEHIFTGCAIEKMKISAKASSIVTANFDIVGAKDTKGVVISPPSYGMGNIFTGSDVSIEIAGSTVAANIESLNLELNFNPDLKGSIGLGSRFAKKVFRGGLDAELSFEMAFESTTELERFWGSAGATGPQNSVGSFAVNVNVGPNLDIIIPRAVYTSMGQPLAGRDRITQSGKIRCFRSIDGQSGPVSFTLVNNKTSYNV